MRDVSKRNCAIFLLELISGLFCSLLLWLICSITDLNSHTTKIRKCPDFEGSQDKLRSKLHFDTVAEILLDSRRPLGLLSKTGVIVLKKKDLVNLLFWKPVFLSESMSCVDRCKNIYSDAEIVLGCYCLLRYFVTPPTNTHFSNGTVFCQNPTNTHQFEQRSPYSVALIRRKL